jgi:hypothetical protein
MRTGEPAYFRESFARGHMVTALLSLSVVSTMCGDSFIGTEAFVASAGSPEVLSPASC